MKAPATLAMMRFSLILFAWSLCLVAGASEQSGMPVSIAAEYHPGYGTNYAWRASVRADGSRTQEVKKDPGVFAEKNWVQRNIPLPSHKQRRVLCEAARTAGLGPLAGPAAPPHGPREAIT